MDLSLLRSVLRGLSLEHLAQFEHEAGNSSGKHELLDAAVQAYQHMPMDPPPPTPEAQRFAEVGLSRLAHLAGQPAGSGRDVTESLAAQRRYFVSTQTFTAAPPVKRMLMYHAHLSTLLSHFMPTTTTLRSGADPPNDINISSFDIQSTFKAYEQLLLATPALASFPRAGDPSHNMYAYMALLYAFWDLGHVPSQWVVDSLYRALDRTFASQRLHRYLVMVLSTMSMTASDRRQGKKYADDAIRNLRLYIKLFEKSRETDQVAVQREVTAFRRKREGEETVPEVDDPEEEHNPLETDEDFCRTACMGIRLLLAESGKDHKQEQEDDRLDLIKEAFDLSEKASKVLRRQQIKEDVGKDKLTGQDGNAQPQALPVPPGRESQESQQDSGVIAEVSLWFGIAQAEWILAEADPETAKVKAQTALKSLITAQKCLPHLGEEGSGAAEPKDSYLASFIRARVLYSVAFAQLEVRNVVLATATAQEAVDALKAHPATREAGMTYRIWHLLVLAISAQKEWAKARAVAEQALGEVPESDDSSAGDITRFADTTYASEEDQAVESLRNRVKILTPSDAPHDPITLGNPTMHLAGAGATAASGSGSSSFVNVGHPSNGANCATRDYATGEASSDLASLARKRKISQAGSARSAREQGLMTHRTSTPWEDLEAEIDLWITRNRCIEAVEGPEVALNDLQRNVLTRFSAKRDELEDLEKRRVAAATAASITQKTATFPYASPTMQNSPSLQRKLDHQRAQTVSGADSPGRARSLIGTFSLRHRSRTNSTQVGSPQTQAGSPQQPSKLGPHFGHLLTDPPVSVHLAVPKSSSRPDSIHSNESVATSNSGSHLMGTNASMVANSVHTGGVSSALTQHPHAARILAKLWLACAACFRRWGKYDECRGAISEAEDLAGEVDPDVWVQYALYLQHVAGSPAAADTERIYLSLQKAIAISTDHVPISVTIGKIHLEQGKWAMAEGFLDVAAQTNAWDSPEAWFLLAKVYEATKRDKRARECLMYALELEQSRPIRDLRSVLTRWV